MRANLQLCLCLSVLCSAFSCCARGITTRDMQVTQMHGVDEIKPGSDPAEGGAWGDSTTGLQVCLRPATNTLNLGESVIVYAFLRNATNRAVEYAIDVGLKPAAACDFVLTDAKGREQPYLPTAVGAIGSSRTKRIPPLTQDRYWVSLDKIFRLAPGDYRLVATARVVTPDGKRFISVSSGPMALKVLK